MDWIQFQSHTQTLLLIPALSVQIQPSASVCKGSLLAKEKGKPRAKIAGEKSRYFRLPSPPCMRERWGGGGGLGSLSFLLPPSSQSPVLWMKFCGVRWEGRRIHPTNAPVVIGLQREQTEVVHSSPPPLPYTHTWCTRTLLLLTPTSVSLKYFSIFENMHASSARRHRIWVLSVSQFGIGCTGWVGGGLREKRGV